MMGWVNDLYQLGLRAMKPSGTLDRIAASLERIAVAQEILAKQGSEAEGLDRKEVGG
jgi:hypothetical protein